MPTITEIRAAAQRLADARRESTAIATALEHALVQAAQPIYLAYRPSLDDAAAVEAEAHADLLALVETSPGEFKRPRSLIVDGVKTGYRKEEDDIDYDSEDAVISRIVCLEEFADLAQALIRTERRLNISALKSLEASKRRLIGVRSISGADQPFISFVEGDVEKLAKTLRADAQKRQGDQADVGKTKGKKRVPA